MEKRFPNILIMDGIHVFVHIKSKDDLLFKGSKLSQFQSIGLVPSLNQEYLYMEILLYTRRLMAIMGYLPGERIYRFEFVHSIVSSLILVNLLTCVITSVVFVVRHFQIDEIENCLHASFCIAGVIPMIASFTTIIYHKKNVRIVIDTFQKIYDNCKEHYVQTKNEYFKFVLWSLAGENKPSAVFFNRADILSEKFFKYAVTAVFGGYILSSLMLAATDAIFLLMRDGYIESENLYLPFVLR